MPRTLLVTTLLLLGSLLAQSQVTFVINDLPKNHPQNAPIYLAGTINNWNPSSAAHQLQQDENGNYAITLELHEEMAFKFTRGDWSKVEADPYGNDIGNRSYRLNAQDTVFFSIQGWKDLIKDRSSPHSTRSENVSIIEAFEIPQLQRQRDIWIYLPPDYAQSTAAFPVIYMHDGQNLFDAATSFSGEWKVDETLNQWAENNKQSFIVVGIANGEAHRMNEYAPWVNDQYGGGEGEAYVSFITETLKPYIDSNFRTLAGPEHTALVGSSLGGIISFYAGLQYPEVFGKIGALSPAFWYNPEFFAFANTTTLPRHQRLYLSAGGEEPESVAANITRISSTLLSRGWAANRLQSKVHAGYGHNETYWASIFEETITFLFDEAQVLNTSEHLSYRIDNRQLRTAGHLTVAIYGLAGQQIFQESLAPQDSVDLSGFKSGIYILQLQGQNQQIVTERILLR